MATPDKVPAEQDRDRHGPQMTAGEARAIASDREVTPPAQREGPAAPGELDRGASGEAGSASINDPGVAARLPLPEAALGGADSIQKTTWGVGTGTEPDGRLEFAPVGRLKGEGPVVARTSSNGGINPVAWVVGVLAVLAAALYALGIFSS